MEAVSIDRIRFENLTFGYVENEVLFKNVDFEFPTGKVVWVKADGGAGRSTLLQLLASLVVPDSGSYWINDQNVTEMSFEDFLPFRLKIGYGFDLGGLIYNRTILDNMMLPVTYHGLLNSTDAQNRATRLLEAVGISKFKDQRPALIPGGVRKLVCLLRPLMTHPQLLLLDDPSVGPSKETILKYFDLVQDLRDQGVIKHVYLSSFDEKLMSILEHTEIYIQEGLIYGLQEDSKKVVHL